MRLARATLMYVSIRRRLRSSLTFISLQLICVPRWLCRITPILEELHWLPIEKGITFKLATLSYNIKSTGQPVYLRELLSDYQPVCTLRSSSKHVLLLTVNIAETVLATRGLRHSVIAVWNSLRA